MGCMGFIYKGTNGSDFNAQVIEEFRATGGSVSGWFEDKDVLILHTSGARSGLKRLAPLVYRREGDASSYSLPKGAATRPRLVPQPQSGPHVTVEIGSHTSTNTAIEIVGEERDAIYARQAAALDNFATYQAGTDRIIRLSSSSPSSDRSHPNRSTLVMQAPTAGAHGTTHNRQ